ncbi:MAG: hypothetical protein GWP19_15225 [Planctomycetia bacterium]|nr:hypothetical protein [Planctomycetia bacterium]
MAKEIEKIKPPVKKRPVKKGVKQVNIRSDVSEFERNQILSMTSDITKIVLRYRKIIGLFITMDVNGKFQIVHFGAGPEIGKRSKYLADNIAKSIKPLIDAYDMPVDVDLPDKKIES